MRTRPWFRLAGEQAVSGAPENSRDLGCAQRQYSQEIFRARSRMAERGMVTGWIPSADPEETFILGGKHVVMSLGNCVRDDASHPNVVAGLQ